MNTYEALGPNFLKKHKVQVRIARKDAQCPPWEDDDHNHGDRYEVTLTRGPKKISYFFWNTWDNEVRSKAPSVAMILQHAAHDTKLPASNKQLVDKFKMPQEAAAVILATQGKLKKFFSKEELRELWHMALEEHVN